MNRPGPQQLRAMPSSMFQNQQQPNASRGAPFTSGRLQNGKIASGSSWGSFAMPMGAPPRTNATTFSSYVQTVSGQQPQASLDPSEFPSLSNAPQPQNQNSAAHAVWTNPSLRGNQNILTRRTQNQISNSHSTSSAQHSQQEQINVQGTSTTLHSTNATEDFRFANQSGPGQLSGLAQTQPGNSEDFPPLERTTSDDVDNDRRTRVSQQSGAPGGPGRTEVSGSQGRNGVVGGQDATSANNATNSGDVATGQVSILRPTRTLSNAAFPGLHQLQGSPRSNSISEQQQESGNRPPQQSEDLGIGAEINESPNMAPGGVNDRLSNMAEIERYGLPGLLTMISDHSPDHSSLAIGQDLTVVGLDLNRPDNSPLYSSFATPFTEPNARPVIPEYLLPAAYTVTNVPPLHTKMSSFSDETLFAIFYQYPRDIMQEIAAGELYSRDWRWHKELRQWMMKDNNYGVPIRITDKQERGFYIFFDVTNWRRERREFLLTYDHLDQRHGPPQQLPSVA